MAARDSRFDAIKGIGAICVVLLHVSGNRSRLIAEEGSRLWWALKLANLATNFAVPLFLLLSVWLWTASWNRRSSVFNFGGVRLMGVLVPYLVWSGFYLVFLTRTQRSGVWPASDRIINDLIYGKTSYHLYFMILLIQLVVLVPIFGFPIRRLRMPWWGVVILGLLLQVGVFTMQRAYWPMPDGTQLGRLTAPGSFALWTVAGWLPAVWAGLNGDRFRPTVWVWATLAITTGIGGRFFFQDHIGLLNGQSPDTSLLLWSSLLFAYGAAWMIALGVRQIPEIPFITTALAWLGRRSLQVYLVHPAWLIGFASPRFNHYLPSGFANFAATFGLTLVASILTAVVISALRLDGILFGQWSSRSPAPKPAAGSTLPAEVPADSSSDGSSSDLPESDFSFPPA